jgi:class 3 adenylate cyclase/tetratricopeptide (TPR) repeat protein
MQCPNCRADNRPDYRYCAACGAALPTLCPACGFANDPDNRFCGGCGRAIGLAPADTSAPAVQAREQPGERRQVTVLFADLSGFTELSGRLDAEDLHALMGRFFETVDCAITGYGGSVDKHIGDAVMGVFGAPVAHGDDPLRAARAAIDIHGAVAALGNEIGHPLAVHVGVASGEVVAAGLGSDRHSAYTVLGEAVNLAARLVELARPGETLVSDPVRRVISPPADCADLGEVPLRGIDGPTRLWQLEGLRTDAATASLPFVGRAGERRQFAGLLEACRDTGHGKVMLLRGEAGIGKTRLVAEMAAGARASGFDVHLARVLDFGTGTGRDPARVLTRALLGLDAQSDQTQRGAAADMALASGRLAAVQRPFLLDLLDLPQPISERALYDAMDNATRNRGKQQTLAALVLDVAARGPLMIVMEDIHWADPPTLAHLSALAVAIRPAPVILVMTTRIEGDPLNDSWRAATRTNPLVTLDLGPLDRDEALALAGSFLDATNQIALACVERADGNPLFLEQLLRHAEISERKSEEQSIPASIQSLVLGRMDRLPPAERQALQAASVVGQQFDLALLRHLIGDPTYDAATLVAHHLVQPEEDGYLFAHALVRDGVYGSLLKLRRRELHVLAATWFASHDPVLAAQHLDRAEDPHAAAAYLAAARQQAAIYHNERALALVDRGLAIAGDGADRQELGCKRGDLLHDLGRTTEALEAFQWSLSIAETDTQRCHAWLGLAAVLRVLDRYEEALSALNCAAAVAADAASDVDLARLRYLRGNLFFPMGRIDECRREHELALDNARRAGSTEFEARALSGLGDAHYAAGRLLTAGDYFARCVALARKHGYGRIEVANLNMAALSRLFACDLDGALAGILEAKEAAVRVGHQRAELVSNEIAHLISYEMDDLDGAEACASRSLVLSRRIGARRFEAEDLAFLGQLLRCRGRRREAMELLEEGLAISREVGMGYIGAVILAQIAAATDDPLRRRSALAEGETILAQGAISHCHLWFHQEAIDVHLAFAEWDEAERSAQALGDYTRAEPLPWSDFYAARGRALAAWGRGSRSAPLMAEIRRLAVEAARCRLGRAQAALDRVLAAG